MDSLILILAVEKQIGMHSTYNLILSYCCQVLNCLAGKTQSKTEASIPFDKFSPGAVSSLTNQQEGFDPNMPAFNINITQSFIAKIS